MENSNIAPLQSPSNTFKFKYVAEEELLRIVRKVKREKQKEKDALQWELYVESRKKNTLSKTEAPIDLEESHPAPSSFHHIDQVHHEKSEDIFKAGLQSQYDQEIIPFEADGHNLPLKRSVLTDGGITTRDNGSLQRIALLRHRISLALDSISGMIQCRPAEPDGPDDLERRKTRINEFLSRFSRNYLFQFQRQVAELRRHIVCASPETPGRHTEYQALVQKLVSAHQTAVQSLQAYLTQIPASLQVTNIFGKLRDLLHHLCDLSSLKNQLDAYSGLIDGYEDVEDADEVVQKCKDLLVLLDEKQAEPEEVSVSARASSPLSGRGSLHPRTQRVLNRTTGGLNQGSWKKTSAFLARAKFGAPSSIRSSVSPHVSSSREHHSSEEKKGKDMQTYNCCNSELRDIVTHMHDVICNKIARKRKKKDRHHSKCKDDNMPVDRRKITSCQKPLTEVQNFSNNVQLVYSKHCDSRVDVLRDVATDTADLSSDRKSEGDTKKLKKVVWATGKSKPQEDKITGESSDNTFIVTPHQSADDSADHHVVTGDSPARHRSASDQRVFSYKHRFQEYNCKAQNPVVQRWCENILDGVFQEISEELEPSFLLEKMYQLEFKDSSS